MTSDFFLEHLHKVAYRVEEALETILPPPTSRLQEAMRYSVLGGGKRLRSFLVWESCQLFGAPLTDALHTAAAVELIQAYSLVHDDLPCMDNADLRRGKPSCHKAFGEATATLVGDALIPLAFQTLSSLEASPGVRLTLIDRLSHTIGSEGLVAGQMRDLGQEKSCQTEEDIRELHRLKTGFFFAFASESGAILGKASLQEREALRKYGFLFGQAFQMIDDLLDGCGNQEAMGKPVCQDSSKLTFFSLLGPDLLYKKAEIIVQKALEVLSPFQERAALLKEAALYVLTRKR
ncbi:MAG: polyprenyl synthetase family protein [Proteobacteria bacterium]|nr:polyprenyl synthetase family protein [Pseudomonadota bacterium]